jgi:hypothetical protein
MARAKGSGQEFWNALAAALTAAAVLIASPDLRAADLSAQIAPIADELVDGLAPLLAPAGPRRPRLAVWPFEADAIPVAKPAADDVTEALTRALLVKAGGRYDVIARDSLRSLIADLERTGVWDESGGAPVATLLKSAGDIDILLEGRLAIQDGSVTVRYRALSRDGIVLAQTAPRAIALDAARASLTAGTLGLDQAATAAARVLADQAPDMSELRLGGIRFEASGEQPPFGLYLQERMATALANAYASPLSDRRLKIAAAEMESERLGRLDGSAVATRDLGKAALLPARGIYLLTGTYWVFPDGIELRLSLSDRERRTAGWTGRLRNDSTGTLALRPGSDLAALRDRDGLGPLAFEVTSGRGRDPAYRIGEKLTLVLRSDRDAWLRCFYRQADRRWVKIFPNAYQRSARLAAGRALTVPGSGHPFDLTVAGPVGTELVKCFAATRDLDADLPPELRADGRILEAGWDQSLLAAFQRLTDAGLSEASLVINVVR